ncbi:hypothetical protein SGLAD_v1c08680 [Spiroplasma gladiatoris]|uniref:Transmembrane protein n=1 Tax=Spiroplasma gladiatoris TaxID=2143 RepID=A0A4P7AIF9_9MOLU|nr:hypothetical protein [Spiroplasma gladiatoris]QBQ08067.1 hypothetical protein SGLAD_v1c08680 [Spiroplasma gladiatoris]
MSRILKKVLSLRSLIIINLFVISSLLTNLYKDTLFSKDFYIISFVFNFLCTVFLFSTITLLFNLTKILSKLDKDGIYWLKFYFKIVLTFIFLFVISIFIYKFKFNLSSLFNVLVIILLSFIAIVFLLVQIKWISLQKIKTKIYHLIKLVLKDFVKIKLNFLLILQSLLIKLKIIFLKFTNFKINYIKTKYIKKIKIIYGDQFVQFC